MCAGLCVLACVLLWVVGGSVGGGLGGGRCDWGEGACGIHMQHAYYPKLISKLTITVYINET